MRRSDIVNALIARGYRAEEQETTKNGVIFEGIVIKGDDAITPVIYTERIIEEAERTGKTLADVVVDVIRAYEEHSRIEFDTDLFSDPDWVLAHLYIGLQRASEERLEKKKTEFDGIEAYLYIRAEQGTDREYMAKMREGFLGTSDVSVEDAWMRAQKNTFEETRIQSMAEVMAELIGVPADELEYDVPMYVLTNKGKCKGASAILDKDALASFAFSKGTNKLVVMPSSIHEMLVIPYDGTQNLEVLSEMVAEINAAEVAPEERLTDRAYLIEA